MEILDAPFRLNDRFSITHKLGEGGQGTAYWGIDEETQTPIAVKKLNLDRVANWKSVDLFRREIAVLFQLDHHSIPTCIDGFRGSDHNFYLIEEYIEGEDLRKLQRRGKTWSDAELIKVMTDCLGILAYLHRQLPPVIHRDVKPANIIQNRNGAHVLVDFGAVSLSLLDNTGTTLIGTPGYMPLEQLSGKAVPASDLHALGATIASLATGLRASELPTNRGKIEIGQLRKLPLRLEQSLDAMLEPIVEDRPVSVEALIGLGESKS